MRPHGDSRQATVPVMIRFIVLVRRHLVVLRRLACPSDPHPPRSLPESRLAGRTFAQRFDLLSMGSWVASGESGSITTATLWRIRGAKPVLTGLDGTSTCAPLHALGYCPSSKAQDRPSPAAGTESVYRPNRVQTGLAPRFGHNVAVVIDPDSPDATQDPMKEDQTLRKCRRASGALGQGPRG